MEKLPPRFHAVGRTGTTWPAAKTSLKHSPSYTTLSAEWLSEGSKELYRLPELISMCTLALAMLVPLSYSAATDWPAWRFDAGRTNETSEPMPAELHLHWLRQLPVVKPAFRKKRLQFDQGYEPIVVKNTMFVALPHLDAVAAYAADSGKERWCFYTDGPIRLAPVSWEDSIYFGSDDGHLYCVDASSGTLKWKFKAVPSRRKIMGNGRMISVWPIRGGPVIADGTVYFAAGIWPLEGVFVYAVDAKSGDVIWVNERAGSLYGHTPHGGQAFAGLTPQGYVLVDGDNLVVPCGTARPATFDRHTGKLLAFSLPEERNNPGGWFMATNSQEAKDVRRGKVLFDSDINQERHEGKPHVGPGSPGVRSRLISAGQTYNYSDGIDGVDGTIHSMLIANERLFVVTLEGRLYAFGARKTQARKHDSQMVPSKKNTVSLVVSRALKAAGSVGGYALVLGTAKGDMAEQLANSSGYNVIALTPEEQRCDALRRQYRAAGIVNRRLSVLCGSLTDQGLPPYFADLIIAEDWNRTELAHSKSEFLKSLYERLRPYGGVACLTVAPDQDAQISAWLKESNCPQAVLKRDGEVLMIRREGRLPGAVDYNKDWTAADELVKAPLGILWFDDSIAHFKRSPQPSIRSGVMMSQDKNWLGPPIAASRRGHYHEPESARFGVLENRFSDVYTGRVLSLEEATARMGKSPEPSDKTNRPPYNYRPPFVSAHVAELKAKGKKQLPLPFLLHTDKGEMINPITGLKQPRNFVKSYGCDGGNDYGHFITMRSATPAFYDKRIESGTINISGPRSGCTNSVIPANGVLNVPFFYDGCSCSYPLPTGAALISMPQTFEQWTAWGNGQPKSLVRIGINLGAPGDRMTNEGTLFVDYPSVGGPSPEITVSTLPETPGYFYHHAVFTKGGQGWPWVCASGATGVTSLDVAGLKKGRFTARLYFIEPEYREPGRRVFDVVLQGKTVLERYDVLADTESRMRCAVKEFRDVQVDNHCRIQLKGHTGATLLCGIELVSSGLPLDSIANGNAE